MRLNRKQVAALGVVAAMLSAFLYFRVAPDRYDVSAPLTLTDAPTIATPFKLNWMSERACFDALDRAGVDYIRVANRATGRGCGFDGAAQIKRTTVDWGEGMVLTCPMAAALFMWEMHDLQPAAERYFNARVERIDSYGSYACRNINNQRRGGRSQHATANAIDIAGFRLSSGARISLLADWRGDRDRKKFLRKLHHTSCFYFNTVLGPEYNELHKDHFHFDQGDWRACR